MTKTPRGITARQFIRALHADGFILRSSSHGMFFMPWARSEFVPAQKPTAQQTCRGYHARAPCSPTQAWDDFDLRRLGLI